MLVGIPLHISVLRAAQYMKGKKVLRAVEQIAGSRRRYWDQCL